MKQDSLAPRHSLRFWQYEFQKWKPRDAETIVETPVSLTVNGEAWLTFMCTPVHLEALAVGFLYNEGVIESLAEVADARLCEHGDNVDVWLTHAAKKPSAWRQTSGCAGGVTAVDLLAKPDVQFDPQDFELDADAVGNLVEALFEAQSLYRETGGVHTSALSDGERILITAEDVGRHNTLDKIAGLCLTGGIFPQRRILMTTGRISSEMLQKAARLGAPVVISRTSPTSLSIQMAERYGVTLIGYGRKHRFNVYSHPRRVGRLEI